MSSKGFKEAARYLNELADRLEKTAEALDSVAEGKSPNAISEAGKKLGIDVGKKLRGGMPMFKDHTQALSAAQNTKVLQAEQDAEALSKALEAYIATGQK